MARELINPHTGKSVTASGEVADRLISVGFTVPEPKQAPVKRKPKKKSA